MDLQQSRQHILRYWSGTPDQHRGNKPSLPPYAYRRRCTRNRPRQMRKLPITRLRLRYPRYLAPSLSLLRTPRWCLLLVQGSRHFRGGLEKSLAPPPPPTSSASSATPARSRSPSPRTATTRAKAPLVVLGVSKFAATAPSCAVFSETTTNPEEPHLRLPRRRLPLIR